MEPGTWCAPGSRPHQALGAWRSRISRTWLTSHTLLPACPQPESPTPGNLASPGSQKHRPPGTRRPRPHHPSAWRALFPPLLPARPCAPVTTVPFKVTRPCRVCPCSCHRAQAGGQSVPLAQGLTLGGPCASVLGGRASERWQARRGGGLLTGSPRPPNSPPWLRQQEQEAPGGRTRQRPEHVDTGARPGLVYQEFHTLKLLFPFCN